MRYKKKTLNKMKWQQKPTNINEKKTNYLLDC